MLGKRGVTVGTCSMISVFAPLDKYGTRVCPHIRAGISIRIIHGYLDTHKYLRVPLNFWIIFLYKEKYFF